VEEQSVFMAMLELAESLGMEIRRAPAGDAAEHPGGAVVRLKGREILFLDPSAGVADRMAVVASALRGRPELEDRFLPPNLREMIEASPAD